MMRSEQLSQEDALESLRQSCEFVSPNDGFVEQLKMFEEMGFEVDRDSEIYKKFRFKVLGDTYNLGEKIDISKFAADPGLPSNVSSKVTTSQNGRAHHSKTYRCKKCRRIVALLENIVDHIPGEGESSLSWNKRKGGNPVQMQDEECLSIFIEPLQWMTGDNTRILGLNVRSTPRMMLEMFHFPTNDVGNVPFSQWKKGHWKVSYLAFVVMLGSVTSTGRASSAVAVEVRCHMYM